MERWSGRTAVVTGAAGGIGCAICDSLSIAGMKVVGLDVKLPSSGDVDAASASKVQFRRCDISNKKEINDVFKWIEEHLGGTDVLVNCAGVGVYGHVTVVGNETLSDDEIAKVIDVNLKATIFCTRHAVESMKKREFDGHVVNISSVLGSYIPKNERINVYTSSKHGVTAFTDSLTNELVSFNSKIKTTCISPGIVRTSMTAQVPADILTLKPSDVASTVIYAISTPPHLNIKELTVQPVRQTIL